VAAAAHTRRIRAAEADTERQCTPGRGGEERMALPVPRAGGDSARQGLMSWWAQAGGGARTPGGRGLLGTPTAAGAVPPWGTATRG